MSASEPAPLPVRRRKPSRLEHRLLRLVGKAAERYHLIDPGDRIMVCVSGGKDSMVLLHLLRELRRKVPFAFDMIAVHLDQKQPGYQGDVLPRFFEEHGYAYRIVERDTWSIVQDKLRPGMTTCSLCSRLRRGILYDTAVELGCNKIALGHHRDDIIETLLLNAFYSGQLKAMPPRLQSDDGRNVVIRPLAMCAEADIAALAAELGLPALPCSVCDTQADHKRKAMKRLVAELAADNPKVPGNLFAAVHKVVVSHLLDPTLTRKKPDADPVADEAAAGGPGEAFLDALEIR